VRYDPGRKPGLANLAEILSALTGRSPEEVLSPHTRYGELKDACAEAIIAELDPIRSRYDELINDAAELRRILARGAERASRVAEPVLQRAREAIGVSGSSTSSSPRSPGRFTRHAG
jgi:tryptophanyl-tRNA synthetase